eukprot:scaffold109257_cov34-Tisochrysis_lutea.AAC.3
MDTSLECRHLPARESDGAWCQPLSRKRLELVLKGSLPLESRGDPIATRRTAWLPHGRFTYPIAKGVVSSMCQSEVRR